MNYTEKEIEGRRVHLFRSADAGDAAAYFEETVAPVVGRDWHRADSWYGGEKMSTAVKYATTGNDALVSLADEYLHKIEAGGLDTTGHGWQPSLCGAYPVIGDFLAGRPDCMRRRQEVVGERAPVRIIVDTTSSAGIDAEDLHKRGAGLLAFVMALAPLRPVELWQQAALDSGSGAAIVAVRCPTSPLNLGVCAHILTSQAWTRGCGYSLLRQKARSGGGWAFGQNPGAEYDRLMRLAHDCEPQDVLLGGIFVNDPLIKDPVTWINEQLARLRAMTDAE